MRDATSDLRRLREDRHARKVAYEPAAIAALALALGVAGGGRLLLDRTVVHYLIPRGLRAAQGRG